LLRSTPAKRLAKQGFSATGKRFYRIDLVNGLLQREMFDISNAL
jgi:hypothetical protein